MASKTKDKLDETNEKIEDLQREQEELKSALSEYGTDYDGVVASISNYEAQISDKQQEIAAVEEQIKEIEEDINVSYELMKKRIKYTYENGSESYLSQILCAKSISSLLTRMEYAAAIKEYDEELINGYILMCETLEEKKTELGDALAELSSLKTQCEEKRENLSELISSAENSLAISEEELEEKMKEAEALEAQIEKEKLAAAQKAAEEAARAEKEAASVSDSNYSAEAGDEELMAAIIYCEAGGESYEGQLAVGSVVMNRVNSSSYPNTVRGVIYQSGQFSPVASGKFELVLSSGSYTTSCVNAAREVLAGHITVSFYHFHSGNGWTSDYGTWIGNQVFY